MSSLMIAALAGLLAPQTAPHPSTLQPYAAPVIRPFEPEPEPEPEAVVTEGAAPAEPLRPPYRAPYRPPLAAPVTVDAYDRSYEAAPTEVEIAYEQGVVSAEVRADQTAGPLDRWWVVRDAEGRRLYELVLMDSGFGPVEGGWRSERDAGGAVAAEGVLTLDDGTSITLERAGDGWRGRMTRDGQARAVTLTRPD